MWLHYNFCQLPCLKECGVLDYYLTKLHILHCSSILGFCDSNLIKVESLCRNRHDSNNELTVAGTFGVCVVDLFNAEGFFNGQGAKFIILKNGSSQLNAKAVIRERIGLKDPFLDNTLFNNTWKRTQLQVILPQKLIFVPVWDRCSSCLDVVTPRRVEWLLDSHPVVWTMKWSWVTCPSIVQNRCNRYWKFKLNKSVI